MRECLTCHAQTPEGSFCVRCGAPLRAALERPGQRRQFAAAPAERRYAPWLISTLFPHLPRHSGRHFRSALIAGATLVVVLGILRLFGVALISAALLMPLLTLLYFYDVDIYEGEPGWASAWTLAWGAAAGVAVGLLAKAIEPSGAALIDRGSTGNVLTGGVLIPALGVLVALAGPLVLLRNRRFNETLDGATFGASTAATFAAAEVIIVGAGVLSGGLRPAGAAAPWVERLMAIAIATPVLSMSALGAAAAAIWLRYRAPVTDRHALGVFGSPPVSILLALGLVIAGALGETFMPAGAWLAWLVLLDLISLVLLRRALHVGLLEEAAEIEIGPTITCTNCGASTATHTFCSSCGIALKALPKVRPEEASADAPALGRGSFAGRLSTGARRPRAPHRRLIAYGLATGAVAGLAAAIAAVAAPPSQKPRCKVHEVCSAPPLPSPPRTTLASYLPWRSPALGYSLRCKSGDWQLRDQTATGVVLQSSDGISSITFSAAPRTQASPSRLLGQRVSVLRGELLGMVPDTNPSDLLLGTGIGLRPGPGAVFQGTQTVAQAPQQPVSVAIMGASDGRVAVVASVIAPADNLDQQALVYKQADDILASVQWAR